MKAVVVDVEQESGVSKCFVASQIAADALLAQSHTRAAQRCLQLADQIEAVEPQRAQRLRTVANDPNSTRDQRWGAYKNDERAPRESQIESETRIR